MSIGAKVRAVAAGLVGVASLMLIIYAPFAFGWLFPDGGGNWVRLANIGQAYGGISALLSTLAIGGVAATFFIQSRQTSATRVQIVRSFQFDLYKMCLAEPEKYWPIYDASLDISDTITAQRRTFWMYNLNALQAGYLTGVFQTQALRQEGIANLFKHQLGRDAWTQLRPHYYLASVNRREQRFARLVDEVYQEAVAHPPVAIPSPPDTGPSRRITAGAAGTAGALFTALAVVAVWRGKQRRQP